MSVYTIFWLVLFILVYFLPIGMAILIDNLSQNPEQKQSATGRLNPDKTKFENSHKSIIQSQIWQKSWILGLANLVILIAYFIFHKNIWNLSWANFGLHFGGGVCCGLIFEYFLTVFENRIFESFNFKSNLFTKFWLQFILVYFLVSGFGVGNELLEFLLDRIGNLPFSTDRLDTWFDLTANSLGAVTTWFIIYFAKIFRNKFKKNKFEIL